TIAAAVWISSTARAQVFGNNLVLNGDAEVGPASQDRNRPVTNVPGWVRMGNPDVVSYGDSDRLHLSSPAPVNHGSHYFIGGPANGSSVLVQDVDVSVGST